MSSSYEDLRQPARAGTGIRESEESDATEDITQEPVQEMTPDSLPDEDWQGIDFLDEEYGIQWNGHEPNMEELLEVPDTPQSESANPVRNENESEDSATEAGSQSTEEIGSETLEAVLFAADIARSIREKPTRFSHEVRRLCYDMSDYCPHQNLGCWERETTIWDEHLKRCPNHPIFCGICHRMNAQDWIHLRQITHKRGREENHKPCHNKRCDCIHYDDHPQHDELPWIVCYTDACDEHFNEKAVAQYWPKRPQETTTTCPCNDQLCACSGYRRHSNHASMHWSKCFEYDCLIHEAESKQFEPSPKSLSLIHISEPTRRS